MLFDQANRELELTERHLIVLRTVIKDGPIGILKLAEKTSMLTHKVRYSLRVLEQEHLIKPSSQGAVAGDDVDEFLSGFNDEITMIYDKIGKIRNLGN
ncbi:MAG: hypothetical protein K8R64_03725 [Methanosarcinaceae archaeon]|nr:hypothetical protein [Methanosarcinaceae archaeon]